MGFFEISEKVEKMVDLANTAMTAQTESEFLAIEREVEKMIQEIDRDYEIMFRADAARRSKKKSRRRGR